MSLNLTQRTQISDLPDELIERIAATIITGDRVGARDIFAFAEVSRRWRGIAISLARLVANGAPDLTDRPWEELGKPIDMDELHPASAQSKLLREVASNSSLGSSDEHKHFYCQILGNLLQHPPPVPRQFDSHTLSEYDSFWLKHNPDIMLAEVIGRQMTFVDWRGYPPRLLQVQLARPPPQKGAPNSKDFRVDVLRKPGSIEAVAVLIQTREELACLSLGEGADSNKSICLALDECFSEFKDQHHSVKWVPAETDEATSDTLRWTRVVQRTKNRYCLELLILRHQASCWQPTYSGIINIDTFPIGSDPCKIEAYVIQDRVHLIAFTCWSMKSYYRPAVETDTGWIGFSSVSQDAIMSDLSGISEAEGVQILVLKGRRRCSSSGIPNSDIERRLDRFLFVSQDHRHAVSMTSKNVLEVHSRRSADCSFNSEPSHTFAAGWSGCVRPVGILEGLVVYTVVKDQTLDIGIFNFGTSSEGAPVWTFEDVLTLEGEGYTKKPTVWISETTIVAIDGLTPVAILSKGSHDWKRSNGAEEMAAALGWSGTVATKIWIPEDRIQTDRLALLIISGMDLVALALCRRKRPPTILDIRSANISTARPSKLDIDALHAAHDDGLSDDFNMMEEQEYQYIMESSHLIHDDPILLLEGNVPVLIRTADGLCRFFPRIKMHQHAQWDWSSSVFLQYLESQDPDLPEDLSRLREGPLMILRSSNDRTTPVRSSGTQSTEDGAAANVRSGMKLSHVTVSEGLRSAENQPHRELVRTTIFGVQISRHMFGPPPKSREWTLLLDGTAIWTGDVSRFLALAQAKVPDSAITA